jgi:hypothetical protein
MALLLAALSLFATSCSDPTSTTASTDSEANGPSVASTNSPSTKPSAEFEQLKGKWERPDGGYILEIRGVEIDGKMDAGYFNPSPIKVSRARTYREGGKSIVFVELNDVNYPGCTYKLTYDPEHDQLFGQYFQASMQQTFDVTFAHQK